VNYKLTQRHTDINDIHTEYSSHRANNTADYNILSAPTDRLLNLSLSLSLSLITLSHTRLICCSHTRHTWLS